MGYRQPGVCMAKEAGQWPLNLYGRRVTPPYDRISQISRGRFAAARVHPVSPGDQRDDSKCVPSPSDASRSTVDRSSWLPHSRLARQSIIPSRLPPRCFLSRSGRVSVAHIAYHSSSSSSSSRQALGCWKSPSLPAEPSSSSSSSSGRLSLKRSLRRALRV